MLGRIITIVLIFLVVAVVGIIIINLLGNPFSNVKTLTINRNGEFTTQELRLTNDQKIKIKNDDDIAHEVRSSTPEKDIADVAARRSSEEITLDDNTRYELGMSENDNTAVLIVGEPEETEEEESSVTSVPTATPTATLTTSPTKTPTPTVTPTPRTQGSVSTSSGNQNLPRTGGEDYLIFLMVILIGLGIYRYSHIFRNYN